LPFTRLAETASNDAGMQAVGGDALAGYAPRQLAGKENVCELGFRVDLEAAVAVLGLQFAEVELRAAMDFGSRIHDARGGGVEQARKQPVGKDEIRQVIRGECQLIPFSGHLTFRANEAGVIDQNVDARLGGGDFARDAPGLGDQ
jgi:hypothetical protein